MSRVKNFIKEHGVVSILTGIMIVVFTAIIGTGFGYMVKVESNISEIEDMECVVKTMKPMLVEIQVDIGKIQTDIKHILINEGLHQRSLTDEYNFTKLVQE